MSELIEIKKKIKHGDLARIAELSNKSRETVYKVFGGSRNNKEVVRVAKQYIAARESIKFTKK